MQMKNGDLSPSRTSTQRTIERPCPQRDLAKGGVGVHGREHRAVLRPAAAVRDDPRRIDLAQIALTPVSGFMI
jgi:hypothetical protein